MRFLILFFALALALPAAQAQTRDNSAPRVSPNASVSQTIGTTEVTVTYGRPSVRDRDVFGGIVPFDEVWRTGANEATTITVSDAVSLGDEELAPGTYSLFTIPGEASWTIIVNDVAEQWGAFNYDPSQDAVRVMVEPEDADDMEQLLFYFTDVSDQGATLVLHWADVMVPIRIGV